MRHNTNTTTWIAVVAALLLTVGALALFVTAASATMYEANVTADDPANETVEVDVDFTADTAVDVELIRDENVVADTTIDGADGVETGELALLGLDDGEFQLEVSDDEDATVDATRLVYHETAAVNATENETIAVDVEFAATEDTEATVEWDQGTESNTTTLEFDPVEFEDGTGWKTAEWDAETDGEVDVTVTTEPAASYESVNVDSTTGLFGGGGGLFGASQTQVLGFLAVVLGLAFAYQRDMI